MLRCYCRMHRPVALCKSLTLGIQSVMMLVNPSEAGRPTQQRVKSAGVREQLPLGRAAERTGATAGGLQRQLHWAPATLPVVRSVLLLARHPSPCFKSQTLSFFLSLCSYGPQVSGACNDSAACSARASCFKCLSSALCCVPTMVNMRVLIAGP
jgi:hypothetical protein